MAYRIVIELEKECDLRDASNVYNLVMQLMMKRVGSMTIESIELTDENSYETILQYKRGYYIQKHIDKYNTEQEERKNLAFQKAAKKIIDSLPLKEEEEEDAKH